jgi:hypothetical protein
MSLDTPMSWCAHGRDPLPVVRRFVHGSLVGVMCLLCAACASGGGNRPAPPPAVTTPAEAPSPLEGEWRLTALQFADGASRRVTGFLRMDRFSTITVHAELASDEPAARPPRTVVADFTARASVGNGAFDYAGLSMGVGRERLTEDAVPMEEWRYYELSGDTLRLSARDRAGRAAATLVFERVR